MSIVGHASQEEVLFKLQTELYSQKTPGLLDMAASRGYLPCALERNAKSR